MTPSTPTPNYDALFDAAWFASQPPAKQPLYVGRPYGPRPDLPPLTPAANQALCTELIAEGYLIDQQIDWFQWDPLAVMGMRQEEGDQWVPAGLGNSPSTAEQTSPNVGPMPPGALIVSTLLTAFPPYPTAPAPTPSTPPAPPPIPQLANPVGPMMGNPVNPPNWSGTPFYTKPNDGWAVGQVWTGTVNGLTGDFQKNAGLMGQLEWTFTAVAPAAG